MPAAAELEERFSRVLVSPGPAGRSSHPARALPALFYRIASFLLFFSSLSRPRGVGRLLPLLPGNAPGMPELGAARPRLRSAGGQRSQRAWVRLSPGSWSPPRKLQTPWDGAEEPAAGPELAACSQRAVPAAHAAASRCCKCQPASLTSSRPPGAPLPHIPVAAAFRDLSLSPFPPSCSPHLSPGVRMGRFCPSLSVWPWANCLLSLCRGAELPASPSRVSVQLWEKLR